MENAKAAVQSHIARDGERETSVHEHVLPSVQHESVQPHQHENVYRPVDREVHQDHHHTKIQPIQHQETLPEKHTHVQEGVEKKHIKHGNDHHVKQSIEQEAAQLGLHHDKREVADTHHTSSEAPSVQGEHVHHHVHEHIQPVIQKETIQPHVIHRTKPVHEIHQHEAQHHAATTLPPVTMDEFKHQGGSLGGAGERTDAFAGEPGNLNSGHIGGVGAHGTTSLTHPEGSSGEYRAPNTRNTAREGTPGTNLSHGESAGRAGSHAPHEAGVHDTREATPGARRDVSATPEHVVHAQHKKPSLLDRLNPKKDADGDGKAGFMS